MIAERPFDYLLFRRIDVTFDNEIAIGRNPQIVGQTFDQLDRPPP